MTLLIVDDEQNIRQGLCRALSAEGYDCIPASTGAEAWDLMNRRSVDLVITDLRMPEMGGFDLLKKTVAAYPTIPVIVLTGHGTIETAVQAIRKGAFEFLTKPVNLDRLSLLVKQAFERSRVLRDEAMLASESAGGCAGASAAAGKAQKAAASGTQKTTTQKTAAEAGSQMGAQTATGMTATSPRMDELMTQVRRVAPTNVSVLVTGETGVGKELLVDEIHALSSRAKAPLIKVHCASLSPSLLESELFGHEKGAFTGATTARKGRFERANGGTLFLDEIGEISQDIQVKILRVLQERSFERVGGQNEIEVDIRIVAATNRDLAKEVQEGRFREDLYYRLNVVNLKIPPLRERVEDIAPLAQRFVEEFSKENGRTFPPLSDEVLDILRAYAWPGNIRELRNAVLSAVVLAEADELGPKDFPNALSSYNEHNARSL